MGRLDLSRIVCILALSAVFVMPAYSEEFNYAQTQRRISVNEEFGDYMSDVRSKISQTWTPPNVLEEGHAGVVFKIDKNGNVISSYIKESSGNALYDESALNSVQKASPYPKFPNNTSREYITVMYSFDSSIVKNVCSCINFVLFSGIKIVISFRFRRYIQK